MPSGPKKRKAAKKKQVKDSSNSSSSSTTFSHHGESDGGELSSPASQDQHNHQLPFIEGEVVEVEKHEASSYQNKSVTVGSTEKTEKEDEGNIEIDEGSKSRKSHDSSSSSSSSSLDDESYVFDKKVVVFESAPVVELVQPLESLPKKIAHEVKDSTVETSSVLDPVKPANSPLEAVSHVNDGTKIDEKLVPELTESVLVENGAAKLPSPEENASSEARDDVAVSAYPVGSVSGVNGADCVNEPETSQYTDRPPPVASAPQAVQTTSWKGCCGILELFSSSDRN